MINVYVVGETLKDAKALADKVRVLGCANLKKVPVTAYWRGRQYEGCTPDWIVFASGSENVSETVDVLRIGQRISRNNLGTTWWMPQNNSEASR